MDKTSGLIVSCSVVGERGVATQTCCSTPCCCALLAGEAGKSDLGREVSCTGGVAW